MRTRSVSAALYNISVQLGNIISANIYLADDAPLYHRGNSVLIGINVLVLVSFVFAKGYYIWKNKRREERWSALTAEVNIQLPPPIPIYSFYLIGKGRAQKRKRLTHLSCYRNARNIFIVRVMRETRDWTLDSHTKSIGGLFCG